jgi:hypothetical protein
MEVSIAVFQPINYIVRNPDASRSEISSRFRMFIDKARQKQAEYSQSLKSPSHYAYINLSVEPSCIVAWTTDASKDGKSAFLKFCKSLMADAFHNRIAIKGYVDHKLVDGKTWLSPDFYYERYSLEWSPEVSNAFERLKSMHWCGVQYTNEAAANTNRNYFITDERGITLPMNESLVMYRLPHSHQTVAALCWLEPIAIPDCTVKEMFRPNFNPEPEDEVLKIIENTKDFLAYSKLVRFKRKPNTIANTFALLSAKLDVRT